jgi:hypothetical protein
MSFITHVITFSLGACFGIVTMCVLQVGAQADKHIEMGEEKR